MTFRFAGHTNSLESLKKFYTEILGFDILGEFTNHDNYNGVFIGVKNTDWHLEFTESKDAVSHKFDDDDMLVFYPDTEADYLQIKNRFSYHNITPITPKNPYWIANGIMILDPDGYRIVVSHLKQKRSAV